MAFSIGVRVTGRNPIPTRRSLQRGIAQALDQAVKRAQDDFKRHTAYYTGGVQVDTRNVQDGVEITSSDYRFAYNALGTKPHVITPRNAGSLAFGDGPYVAKTQPNTIPSRPGGRSGGNTVFRQVVNHPGVEARDTQVAIADNVGPVLISAIREVIRGR